MNNTKMENEEIIRKFEYNGKEIGFLVEGTKGVINKRTDNLNKRKCREFKTDIGELEAIDLVGEMIPEDKIHMKTQAYAIFRLLEYHKINPDDYINDTDVMIHVANIGCQNLTDVYHNDHRAWELVKQRGLEGQLFKDFKT